MTTTDTFTNDLGEQQALFTTTGQQLFRPEMYADTADPSFYKRYAQPGVRRSLTEGLAKETKDLGGDLKDGIVSAGQAIKDNPLGAAKAVGSAIVGLPGAIYDGFIESGHALGEGTAVAFNDDLGEKLNTLYGTDIGGAQDTLLGLRAVTAVAGATGAAKAVTQVGKVGEKLADGMKDRIEASEVKKAAEKRVAEDSTPRVQGAESVISGHAADEVNGKVAATKAEASLSGTGTAERSNSHSSKEKPEIDSAPTNVPAGKLAAKDLMEVSDQGNAAKATDLREGAADASATKTDVVKDARNLLDYEFRSPNSAYPPNDAATNLMRTERFRQSVACSGVDCSELAEDLYEAAGGDGNVLRIESKTSRGSFDTALRTPEVIKGADGSTKKSIDNYVYHEVFTDGRYVYDPRLSETPIPKGDYLRLIEKLNPQGVTIKKVR